MSPRLPDGEPAPRDGALPAAALGGLGERPFGVYLHVPFCASRCGYCDFNTYVGMRTDGYVDAVLAEWELARRVLRDPPPAATVFFGGGTPTLLPPAELGRLLAAIPRVPGAEVTVEANPETVDLDTLRALREAGFTRVSIGMQSAAPHVLAALERAQAVSSQACRSPPVIRRVSWSRGTIVSPSRAARGFSWTNTRPSRRRSSAPSSNGIAGSFVASWP